MRRFVFVALVALVVGPASSLPQRSGTGQNPTAVPSVDFSGQWTTVGGKWRLAPFDFKKSPKIAPRQLFLPVRDN